MNYLNAQLWSFNYMCEIYMKPHVVRYTGGTQWLVLILIINHF